ncbi:hypothetical protein KEM48_002651 [Puccinia striiformis f. sp. tritici PST-130]|nr:hypothetical protein KEM48_002651 [Puccinia striiformis f. sp. tritici PST-130]
MALLAYSTSNQSPTNPQLGGTPQSNLFRQLQISSSTPLLIVMVSIPDQAEIYSQSLERVLLNRCPRYRSPIYYSYLPASNFPEVDSSSPATSISSHRTFYCGINVVSMSISNRSVASAWDRLSLKLIPVLFWYYLRSVLNSAGFSFDGPLPHPAALKTHQFLFKRFQVPSTSVIPSRSPHRFQMFLRAHRQAKPNTSSQLQSVTFAAYEIQDDQSIQDLALFVMSNTVYTALVEPYATEIFARRKAMDNPSSNAHTVIGVLPMKFNRTRQSKINNDLIITGANALP